MIEPTSWRAAGAVAPRAGRSIFVVDSAPGDPARPAVLCLHGYPTASWDWVEVWPALTRERRLVAFDFLGFGFSEKPRGPLRIAEQADIAEAVAAEAGLERFHLLAHDYGDTVGQELLARDLERPETERRLRSVSFLNGGLFPETHRARTIQKLLASPLGPLLTRLLGKRAFERSFAAVFGPDTQPTEAQLAGFWALIERDGGRRLFHQAISYMAERRERRERWVGALVNAPCPIQLVNGSVDPVSGAHMVARYREVVQREDAILELPRIGHYPQVEAPEEVASALIRFWESIE